MASALFEVELAVDGDKMHEAKHFVARKVFDIPFTPSKKQSFFIDFGRECRLHFFPYAVEWDIHREMWVIEASEGMSFAELMAFLKDFRSTPGWILDLTESLADWEKHWGYRS